MSVVLFRVDERLIHGQVVVGWAHKLRPRRIIVVDDALAEDQLEQSIYRTGIPEGMDAEFWSEREAVRLLPAVLESSERAFVLTSDLATSGRSWFRWRTRRWRGSRRSMWAASTMAAVACCRTCGWTKATSG